MGLPFSSITLGKEIASTSRSIYHPMSGVSSWDEGMVLSSERASKDSSESTEHLRAAATSFHAR
jgi:hypothetical protein